MSPVQRFSNGWNKAAIDAAATATVEPLCKWKHRICVPLCAFIEVSVYGIEE